MDSIPHGAWFVQKPAGKVGGQWGTLSVSFLPTVMGRRASDEVARDLRLMRIRAGLSQGGMALALKEELGTRGVTQEQISRWENGAKMPGADVYRAYIKISRSPLPEEVGAVDPRTVPGYQLRLIEERVTDLERRQGVNGGPLTDEWIKVADAAKMVGRSRQTIHNWIDAGKVRSRQVGHTTYVYRPDILGGLTDGPV